MSFKTQRDVDRLSLPPGKAEHMEFDEACRGLAVRIQGEAKVWMVRYALPDGRRPKMKLGDVAGMPLADARKRAAQITSGAKNGHDPQQQREAKKRQAAETFGALVEMYVARYATREQKPKTQLETTRALKVHLAPLHKLPLNAMTRRDVATRLMDLVDSSGPIAANRVRAAISHCFVWAMQQGLVENNPVAGTARPAPETKRERSLSVDELRTVWLAAGDDDYGRIIKVLILTGQRREEVGGMAEAELDRDNALWLIPGARTKNGLEHEVPLSPQVMGLIKAREGRPRLFGRGRNGNGFSGWSQCKVRLDARIARARAEWRLKHRLPSEDSPAAEDALTPWTLHDIRRSFVTIINENGTTPPHIVEAVVNHITGAAKIGVAGVYNRAKYRKEKRLALDAWANFVADLIAGKRRPGNVVALAGAR